MAQQIGAHAGSCTKEDILPILLGNPDLYKKNDDAYYQNWILFGLDLNLQGQRLKEIKRMANKSYHRLIEVVAELLEEWFNEKARIGERASILELVEALKENHLESFSDRIEAAFSRSAVVASDPPPTSPVSSMDSFMTPQELSSSATEIRLATTPILELCSPINFDASGGGGDGGVSSNWRGDHPPLNEFHRAVIENRREDVIKLIQARGVNINALTNDRERRTALHIAAKMIPNRDDAIKIIKVLVNANASLDVLDSSDCPFYDGLFLADGGSSSNLPKLTWLQFDDLVKFFIETGHKMYLETPHGRNNACMLHWAMKECVLARPTIEFLHSKNVNLNCPSRTGNTLMYYAIFGNRSIETIHLLIKLGADWRHLNNSKWNFLHAAAKACNLNAFKYFLELEPKFALGKDKDGLNPVDLLKMYHDGNWDAAMMVSLAQHGRNKFGV